MKKNQNTSLILGLIIALFLTSCDGLMEGQINPESKVPENFSIEIPSSLSNEQVAAESNQRVNGRELDGNGVYRHMNLFIHVGDRSAKLVEHLMRKIRRHNLSQDLTITYTSEEDGHEKMITVIEGSSFQGQEWEYQMNLYDMEETDPSAPDDAEGALALQIFWNTSPVEGIAILKPFYINRTDRNVHPDAMYRVEYSEAGNQGYEKHMIVAISQLQMDETDPYSMRALKMFVGKNGDIIDVYGNSNHPRAQFFNGDHQGFNWAFVASGNRNEDYGVAEVGLPYSGLDATSREVLLEQYSVKSVLEEAIRQSHPDVSQEQLDEFLANTAAPGYFGPEGFIQGGGEAPAEKYNSLLENISQLAPYNPSMISSMTIDFKY